MTNPNCRNCHGKGYTEQLSAVPCPNCGGCGHVPDDSFNELIFSGRVFCPKCGGRGTVFEVETVRIPCMC